jgi:hypothetical protein
VSFATLFTSISFAIAILGFVLAIVSLIANAYQFRASGGLVSVDTSEDSVMAQISDEKGEFLRAERIGTVKITVRNTGRFGASVSDVGLGLPKAAGKLRQALDENAEKYRGLGDEEESFWQDNPALQNATFPHRLEGGESESWVMLMSDVRGILQANDLGSPRLRGIAVLATGKWVFSEQAVNPAARMWFERGDQPQAPAASPPSVPRKPRARHRPIAHLISLTLASDTPSENVDADVTGADGEPTH